MTDADSYLAWKAERLAPYERARADAQESLEAAKERTNAAFREYKRDQNKREEWLACMDRESIFYKRLDRAIVRLVNAEKRATLGEFFKSRGGSDGGLPVRASARR